MKKIDRKSLGDIVISDVFEINMLMDFYKNLLSVKQQKVLSMYYDYDYSLTEIADQLDISKQAVSNNIKRAELRLRFFEKNLKLVKNFMEKKEKDEKLKKLFAELKKEGNDKSKEIIDEISSIIFEISFD